MTKQGEPSSADQPNVGAQSVSLTSLRCTWRVLAVLLLLSGVTYVANVWTPSSYGLILSRLGVTEPELVLGDPRGIRSDEYHMVTPYFQIAVRNGFSRYNELSPYKEDLRAYFALPLLDWSLPFKPQLWAFFAVDPARAYSFYHWFLIAAFVAGYTIVLRQVGVEPAFGALISLLLFFSHFTQVWWTTNGPTFAFAPWPLAAFLIRCRWYVRLPAVAYASAVWLFSLLYPPFIISAAFALAVLAIAFQPERLRLPVLMPSGLAVAIALALVWLYFGDNVQVMRDTVYPGQRNEGGGGLSQLMFLAHLFPYLTTLEFEPLIPDRNACEVSVVSSFFPLAFLIFADYRALFHWVRTHPWPGFVCGVGFAMMAAWMLLPIPAEVGRLLLWNVMPSQRMLWGMGLLLTLGLGVVSSRVPWRLTGSRCLVFTGAVLSAWLASKIVLVESWYPKPGLLAFSALGRAHDDLFVLVPLAVVMIAATIRPLAILSKTGNARGAIVTAVVIAAAGTFGRFNPIQSARPIFKTPETPLISAMRDMAAAHPKGWAALEGRHGAIFNGLGIRTINHALLAPQREFFRPFFPDLPPDQFNFFFNRYVHIGLTMTDKVELRRADNVVLPIQRFGLELPVDSGPELNPSLNRELPNAGHLDGISIKRLESGNWLAVVRGWAPFERWHSEQRLVVKLASPRLLADFSMNGATILDVAAVRLPRPDIVAALADPALNLSGFVLMIELQVNGNLEAVPSEALSISSIDPARGRHAIKGD
jgi:hypothetical protein